MSSRGFRVKLYQLLLTILMNTCCHYGRVRQISSHVTSVHSRRVYEITDCKILSIPFGPKVVFTRSATAIAPTNEDMRACSPYIHKTER
jgi:hypothetical protein